VFLSDHVLGHVRGPLGLRHIVLVSGLHETSLAYTARMHPLEQHYTGGSDYALASFGLTKIALMTPAQKAQFMAARQGRPTGVAAIQAQATPPQLGNVPLASSGGGAPPTVGGPGMSPGFGSGGLPLETSPIVAEKNRAIQGMSLYGKHLPQGPQSGTVPLYPGRNVVGHFLI